MNKMTCVISGYHLHRIGHSDHTIHTEAPAERIRDRVVPLVALVKAT